MADAMMKPLGEANGVNWYWAEPGQFDSPGVYYWDGTRNVLCVPHGAATPPTEAVRMSEAEIGNAIASHIIGESATYNQLQKFARAVEQATAARLGVKMGDV